MTPFRATDTISSPAPAAAGGGSTTASGAAGGLNVSLLENVRSKGTKTVARCPACAEGDGDKGADHLFIAADGRFGCVKNPGPDGAEHRKRIFSLVGVVEKSAPQKQERPRPSKLKKLTTWATAEQAARACTPEGATLFAVYDYPRAGENYGAVARYQLPDEKTFRQFYWTGDGWTLGAPAGKWPLYGVEKIPSTGPVYIVEGEKCAHAAASIGLPVIASAGGSSAASKSDWTACAGREVRIIPDNDAAGEKYAAEVASSLAALSPPSQVSIVRLPLTEPGADIVEWIEAHGDAAEPETLRSEIEKLAESVKPAASFLDGADILREPPPPHEPVLCGLFDRHALVEIVGPSKTRKSFAVSQLALSLAAGKPAFGFDLGGRFSVCIADLELSQADIRRRLWRMGRALGITASDIEDRIRILPLAGAENVRPIIEAGAQGCDVLICDPLYALCDGGEGIEDLRDPLRWLRRLAVQRVAVLFVHHDAKGTPGDRDTRDRGSGSGITGRSVDARITLTPAAADPENTIAMGFMCRSYVCPQPSAWTFTDDAFRTSDLPAEPERMADKRSRQARPKMGTYNDAAVRVLREHGPMQPRLFKAALREELRIAKHAADDLVAHLTTEGGPAVAWHTSGFPAQYFVGLVSQWESRETSGRPRESRES